MDEVVELCMEHFVRRGREDQYGRSSYHVIRSFQKSTEPQASWNVDIHIDPGRALSLEHSEDDLGDTVHLGAGDEYSPTPCRGD